MNRIRLSLRSLLCAVFLAGAAMGLLKTAVETSRSPFWRPDTKVCSIFFDSTFSSIVVLYSDGTLAVFDLDYKIKKSWMLKSGMQYPWGFLHGKHALITNTQLNTLIHLDTGEQIWTGAPGQTPLYIDKHYSEIMIFADANELVGWNIAGRKDRWRIPFTYSPGNWAVESRAGERLAAIAMNQAVHVLDMKEGREMCVVAGGAPVTHMAFSRSGKCLAVTRGSRAISLYDAQTAEELFSMTIPINVYSLFVSEDPPQLTVIDEFGAINSYNDSGAFVRRFGPGIAPYDWSTQFEGGTITAPAGGGVRRWNALTGEETVWNAPVEIKWVFGLSPDLKRLIAFEYWRNAEIWERDPDKPFAWALYRPPAHMRQFYIFNALTAVLAALLIFSLVRDNRRFKK